MTTPRRRPQGRPPATDHATIEQIAFDLFEERGFEATTIEDIATAAGIGRRTLFRYYASKNDIPWGQFEASLTHLRDFLEAMPPEMPLARAVQQGVLEFNRVDEDAIPQHRRRMHLLLSSPALQAHSGIKYVEWRRVIASFVASRTGADETDLLPNLVGRIALALAMSAYEQWLDQPEASLPDLLEQAMEALLHYVGPLDT